MPEDKEELLEERDPLAGSPIIVALDYPTAIDALEFVDQLKPDYCRLKIGKEMFTRDGPELVRVLQNRGFDIFLDLKFHDIPNTVAGAVAAAADLGVWMVNVHASGGAKMMEAASSRLQSMDVDTLLLAVTVLTSMDAPELNQLGIHRAMEEQVKALAMLAADSGLHGVVCSSLETSLVKSCCRNGFLTVTPGIRPEESPSDDQKRTLTPIQAKQAGSDFLVIGRPVTKAEDPVATLERINNQLGWFYPEEELDEGLA